MQVPCMLTPTRAVLDPEGERPFCTPRSSSKVENSVQEACSTSKRDARAPLEHRHGTGK